MNKVVALSLILFSTLPCITGCGYKKAPQAKKAESCQTSESETKKSFSKEDLEI